jgi:cytochrome c-type biogenesis protein CcmE
MEKQQKTIVAILFVITGCSNRSMGTRFAQGYSMVSQLTNDPQAHIGNEVSTMGIIKEWNFTGVTRCNFFLLVDVEDHVSEVEVVYTGDLPATFAEGQGIQFNRNHGLCSENRSTSDCDGLPF